MYELDCVNIYMLKVRVSHEIRENRVPTRVEDEQSHSRTMIGTQFYVKR